MLIIRKAQMEALERTELRKFEERVYQSLQRHWPAGVAARGEASVRASIRHGIERARTYGLTSEREIFTYINLMYCHADDFDRSPEYPWAAEILADPKLEPGAKVERLVQRTLDLRES
ncbi:MAG: hypothetical protein AAB225_15790 [Acidobacteriota bacterium]